MKDKNNRSQSSADSALPPVITIDGPSASGKGTIGERLAKQLGWHFLDSGALYRLVAWAVLDAESDLQDETATLSLIRSLEIRFQCSEQGMQLFCGEREVTEAIRAETVSQTASILSANALIRKELLDLQYVHRRLPGLVADGRDMGTVVFPDAILKFFLVADVLERAERRYNQLKTKGINVSLRDIQMDLEARDRRDRERTVSPTQPAADALIIDTSGLSIEAVFTQVYTVVQRRLSEAIF